MGSAKLPLASSIRERPIGPGSWGDSRWLETLPRATDSGFCRWVVRERHFGLASVIRSRQQTVSNRLPRKTIDAFDSEPPLQYWGRMIGCFCIPQVWPTFLIRGRQRPQQRIQPRHPSSASECWPANGLTIFLSLIDNVGRVAYVTQCQRSEAVVRRSETIYLPTCPTIRRP